jgi:hypothetical protein
MKFFIVTCLKEHQDDICKIFKAAKINVFSATDVIGFKENQPMNLLADWFASGDEKFDSLFVFSFTGDDNAELAMELIKKHNSETETNFPVRAFIVPVESSSY